jgi:hypothetical protein
LYTLNQILSLIENEANAHLQVKQFGQGDVWEINPKELDYLVLWAIEEGVVLNERTLTYNIRLLAMDRVLTGEENEQEVMSDTIQVLLDFVAYFRQLHTTDLSIQTSVSFEPFTERFDDKVSGHACVLSITQPYDYNKCQIPQTTNTIPPTVDGITLYDFCNQATLDRLTLVQIACLEAAFALPCADATVQLNGTTVGTIPSGDSDSFTVNLDGSPSGTWDGTAWQVTSTPCADATVELNGVEMTTIPSGDTENISIRQSSGATEVGSKQGVHWRIDDSAISINGSPVADVKAEDALDIDVTQDGSPVGSWNGSAWIVPPCVNPSLTIGVYSDAGLTTPITSADLNQVVYINLNVVGITTPTEYRFMIFDAIDNGVLYVEAGTPLAYTVTSLDDLLIYAEATDGVTVAAALTAFELASNGDPDAVAFIVAHNLASGQTMGALQQNTIQELVQMLKGVGTIYGSNLWSKLATSNSEIYPFCPVDDSTVNASAYAVDLINPSITATFNNFIITDFSVNGITGGATKYFAMKRAPSDFGQNDIGIDAYCRSTLTGLGSTIAIGASNSSNFTGNAAYLFTSSDGHYALNQAGSSVFNAPSTGLTSINRILSTAHTKWRNGVLLNTASVTSITPSTRKFYGFANNSGGTVDRLFSGQLAMLSARCGFTNNEMIDWFQSWNYYQTNIITGGRNV